MHIEANICKLDDRRNVHVYNFMFKQKKNLTLLMLDKLGRELMIPCCILPNYHYVKNISVMFFIMEQECGINCL